MKAGRKFARVAQRTCWLALSAGPFAPVASAQYTWDPNGVAAGTGGPGNWDTLSSNWLDGTAHVQWNNATPQLAVFDGATGAVQIPGVQINASVGIRFDSPGYVVHSGGITVGGTITANADAQIYSSLIGNGSFIKSGPGTLTLSGANSYAGSLTVAAGRLAADHDNAFGSTFGSTTVTAGATLELRGVATSVEPLTLNGHGATGSGALHVTSYSSWGDITLASDSTIKVDADFAHNGQFSAGSGNLTLTSGVASGREVFLFGSNSAWTGNLTLDNIDVEVHNAAALGGGNMLAITGAGATVYSSTDITRNGAMSINGTGVATFDVFSHTLTLNADISGTRPLRLAGGTMVLSGNNSAFSGGFDLQLGMLSMDGLARLGSAAALYNGRLQITGTTPAANVALHLNNETSGTIEIEVATSQTATIGSGGSISGAGSFWKVGDGTLVLNSANTFAGEARVWDGKLVVGHSNALGGTGVVIVDPGAVMELSDGVSTPASEGVVLPSGGPDGNGGLRFAGSNATWGGAVLMYSGTAIGVDAGTLHLAGTVQGSTGTLTKRGAGTLILSGTNTYPGATNVTAGAVRARSSGAFGTTANGVIVSPGARLELDNNINVTGESLQLSGTGTDGALRNVGGTNTWSGGVTLTGHTRIVADAGALVLTSVAGPPYNLTIGAGAGRVVLPNSSVFNAIQIEGHLEIKHLDSLSNTMFSSTTVAPGGKLEVWPLTFTTFTEPLTLGGASGRATFQGNVGKWDGEWTLLNDVDVVVPSTATFTVSGKIAGNLGLTKKEGGILVLSNTANTQSETVVKGGTLRAFTGTLGDGVVVVDATEASAGLTLLNAVEHTITSLAGNRTGVFNALVSISGSSGGSLVIQQSGNTTYAGVFTSGGGAGGIVIKRGAGTLTLSHTSATSTHNFTRMEGGVLAIDGNGVLGTIAVFDGGTLRTQQALSLPGRNLFVEDGGGATDSNGFNSTFGDISGAGAFIKLGAGTLTVDHVRTASLAVTVGRVTIGGVANDATSAVDTLDTSSGQLDLRDDRLIVRNEPLGEWNGTNYDGVTGMIRSGRNGGNWFGNGIITSMSDAWPSRMVTTLAVASATQVSTQSFGGLSVSEGDVLVMYTYAGDADFTGAIDGDDYARIDAGYSGQLTGYFNGDFNYSGNIDADDYWLIDRNYSRNLPQLSAGAPVGVAAVPEPRAAIAAAGLLSLPLRRRRVACR